MNESNEILKGKVLCIGNRGDNGCGHVGGKSGDTCPKCGGMLLSERSIKFADQVAKEWKEREESK